MQLVTFPQRMKTLRKGSQMSQRELAQRLGFSAGTIAMYETGRREPSFDTIKQLATMFNVSVDYLLGRTDLETMNSVPPPAAPVLPPPPLQTPVLNPVLASLVERMFVERHLESTSQIFLFTFAALTTVEIERLRRGASPAEFSDERLVRFFRKFPLDDIRAYYRAAGFPLPQAFVDLESELREVLDRVRMSTDGSPEALEYIIHLAREMFEQP